MSSYFETFINGYTGYYNYLLNEIMHPHLKNYFYWLIGISLLFFLLELVNPWRRTQPKIRKDFWLDFFYMFFNFFLFSLIIYNAGSDVFVRLFHDLLDIFGIESLRILNVAALPPWAQLLTLFIIRDFIQWNIHRLLHRNEKLWEFHKVHHSVAQMGFAAHLRYHWMENVVYRTLEYIPLAMIGFGISEFFIVHIIALTIGHFNHSNFTIKIGPLKYIFNNPEMHIWHHAEILPGDKKFGVNFGISLSLWDYIFKTNYIPHNGRDIKLGFADLEQFPDNFINQNLHGFGASKK